MPLLESLMNLVGLSHYGENVAQSRYTHTPIVTQPWSEGASSVGGFGQPDASGKPLVAGLTTYRDFASNPVQDIYDVLRRGVNPLQPYIQLHSSQPSLGGQGYLGGPLDPSVLRHETIHAATSPLIDKDPKLFNQISAILPGELKSEVRQMWGATGENMDDAVVHEGLARFLTDSSYSDPKWNKTKQQLIGLFPAQTKGQIIRMLSVPAKPITEVGQ